jgi:hypothetical protein
MIKQILKFIFLNAYAVFFALVPFLLLRYLVPALVSVIPEGMRDALGIFSPESVIHWVDSSYFLWVLVYLFMAYFLRMRFDGNRAHDFEEFGGGSADFINWIIAMFMLLLFPGMLFIHAIFFDLKLIGLSKLRSPLDEENEFESVASGERR